MTQNQFLPEYVLIPHFGKDAYLTGVEIGVMTACGSVAMLDRMPNLTLYCIDPWQYVPGVEYEAGRPQDYHDLNMEHTKNRLIPYGERAKILHKTSDEAVIFIPPQVDFVHIDGHHGYEQVLRDISNYLPKIKLGGIISGHDYVQVPEVTAAVDKLFSKDRINVGDDFLWWVYV